MPASNTAHRAPRTAHHSFTHMSGHIFAPGRSDLGRGLTASLIPPVSSAPGRQQAALPRHGRQRAPSCCVNSTRRVVCCVLCVVLCRRGWPHVRGQARSESKGRDSLASGRGQHQLGRLCRNAMAGKTVACLALKGGACGAGPGPNPTGVCDPAGLGSSGARAQSLQRVS